MKQVCLMVEDDQAQQIGILSRKFSASRIVRHLLRAIFLDDKAWAAYAKTPECKEMRAFMKPFKDRFGLS